MKKIISLIKVSLNHDMNIFRIHTKKQNAFYKIGLPLIITFYIIIIFALYAYKMMDFLKPVHLEFVVLTLFALVISFVTFIEGVYKSGSLLFDCKDDQLLLSLPVKRNTVLFIRIFKLYVFEFLYNSLFILPAMVIYAANINPNFSYYLVSIIALLLLPIIPIILSCLVGFIITFLSSKFKGKNFFQTVFTTLFLILIIYISYNMDGFMNNLAQNASSINDLITKIYYPVGAYISLINDFSIKNFIIYIVSHLAILSLTIFILGKLYFRINSNFKRVLVNHKNNHYKIKSRSKMITFIKKELNKFISTPVFVTNAGFGLVLFIVACIFASLKFDYIAGLIMKIYPGIKVDLIKSQLPVFMFGLVCFTSLMTSITSSMISLEGRAFNILKSLPIKPFNIVIYKLLAALIIMIPCIFIGDIIVFIRFKFDLISIILILFASIILPLTSELIGIIVNLKYPKLDALNDTEIVKQSISSMISVFIGISLIGITLFSSFKMLDFGFESYIIISILIIIYILISLMLFLFLLLNCDKSFNNITS